MENIFAKLIEPAKDIDSSKKKYSNKALLTLISPIIVEQFLLLLVGIADTMMISHVGEAAVSGVSLTNQLINVFILIFTALATGGSVVASQYVGSGEREKGNRAVGQLLMSTVVISGVIMLLLRIFGSSFFSLLFGKVEQGVYDSSMIYLGLMLLSFPFLAIYNSCAGVFRSMGRTKTIMNVSIMMNLINVVGNYIGVFILKAGVAGVAWPTVISRVFASAVLLKLSMDQENRLYVSMPNVLTADYGMIKRIFTVAVPNAIENGLFQFSKVALSSIVAMFGTAQIAANGVAQSFWSMSALFGLAMGPAFVTVIGQCTGAGDDEAAEYYMKKLWRMTYLGSFLWNIVFTVIALALLNLYSLSAEARTLTIMLIFIHNAGRVLTETTTVSNGMRAAGDIAYTMYTSIFSTVVCRVVLSVIFGLWMNLGVIGIAFAMVGDWIIKSVLTVYRFHTGKWKNRKLV